MSRASPLESPPLRGTTLIELLIAISVSLLVMAIVLSVYATVNASRNRQRDRRFDLACLALECIRRDLASSPQPALSNAPALVLENPEGFEPGRSEPSLLTVCSAFLKSGDQVERAALAEVRYTLIPSSDPEAGGTLVRRTAVIANPQGDFPEETNALLRGVKEFAVTVLDGGAWTNRWESRPARPLPNGANIQLTWITGSTSQTLNAFVLIPGGTVFARTAPAHVR